MFFPYSLNFLPKLCAVMGSSYALYHEMLLILVIRTGKELMIEGSFNRKTSKYLSEMTGFLIICFKCMQNLLNGSFPQCS